MGTFRVLIGGIGGSCRRLEQYTEPMLGWMCAVGTAPSKGGARAPISDILSHMGTEVQKLRTLHATLHHPMISMNLNTTLCLHSCSRYRDMAGHLE